MTLTAETQLTDSNGKHGFPGAGVTHRTRKKMTVDNPSQSLVSLHQYQYFTGDVANYFKAFNDATNRPELYFGYIAGCLRNPLPSSAQTSEKREKIAVDFGCGTGWLTPRLATFGAFDTVIGIDTSAQMLAKAFTQTPRELIDSGKVQYHTEIPDRIRGKCSLVAAVHVHYHFENLDKLRTDFFGAIASMLAPDGEAILVGCPSDYIHHTPDHYQNSVLLKDVPEDVLVRASSPRILTDDDDYIALKHLPKFALKEGSQMRVTFRYPNGGGKLKVLNLTDTYWSDAALTATAREAGLQLLCKRDLSWKNHPHAYMMMHFRKM